MLAPEVGSSSTWDEFLEFSTTEKSFKYKNVQLVQIGQTDNDSKWNHLSGSCDNRSRKFSPVQDRLQQMLRSREAEEMWKDRATFVLGTF